MTNHLEQAVTRAQELAAELPHDPDYEIRCRAAALLSYLVGFIHGGAMQQNGELRRERDVARAQRDALIQAARGVVDSHDLQHGDEVVIALREVVQQVDREAAP